MALSGKDLFERRKARVRFHISKSRNGRARLSVHRTNLHTYAQVIDDATGQTLAAVSTCEKELKGALKNGGNVEAAIAVGKLVAERAKKAGVETVIFDRGGYLYHGRIKALADAARENGLNF